MSPTIFLTSHCTIQGVLLWHVSRGVAMIDWIRSVCPKHGHGTIMVAHLKQVVKEASLPTIRVDEVQYRVKAYRFWARAGFTLVYTNKRGMVTYLPKDQLDAVKVTIPASLILSHNTVLSLHHPFPRTIPPYVHQPLPQRYPSIYRSTPSLVLPPDHWMPCAKMEREIVVINYDCAEEVAHPPDSTGYVDADVDHACCR